MIGPMRLTPCVPRWLIMELIEEMQIDEEIAACIGFIGVNSEHGFIADGTCFFVQFPEETEAFLYMVTARHLVRPMRFGKETEPLDGIVSVRLSRKTKPPLVLQTRREEWICHPNRFVDLCVRPFDHWQLNPDGDLFLASVELVGEKSLVLTPERWERVGKISLGDEIFIPSLFPGHVGERRNIPAFRFGNIAAPPLEPVRVGSPAVPAFLIETRSLGGTSGAPVFLHFKPELPRDAPRFFADGPGGRIVPFALIGMVLGAHSGKYASDFVTTDAEENLISTDAEFNAGLSVVLPIEHVVELIQSDEFRSARLVTLDAIKKQSGFRHTTNEV